jgi:hypothetical protein
MVRRGAVPDPVRQPWQATTGVAIDLRDQITRRARTGLAAVGLSHHALIGQLMLMVSYG